MINNAEPHDYVVSVIIPVFDVKDYLSQCVQSVIQQSYHYLDIILIDDGSTDGSSMVCDEFAKRDKRVRVIHTDNHGLSHARNVGLDIRNGEFVFFVDSDDWVETNTIEILLQIAIENEASVVIAKKYIEYEGESISFEDYGRTQVYQGEKVLYEFVKGTYGDEAWSKLYHYSCFENIRFPNGRNYEDTATTWKLIKEIADNNQKIAVTQKAVYHYRMRNGSISRTPTLKNIIDCWNAYHEKYEGLYKYRDYILYSCLKAAGRMWIYYWGFSKEDKNKADKIVIQIQKFARNHINHVLTGEFKLFEKTICIMLLCKSDLWFFVIFNVNRLREIVRRSSSKKAFKRN